MVDGNPEQLRREDQARPRGKRRYPQSLVTKALVLLLVIVVLAWVFSLF